MSAEGLRHSEFDVPTLLAAIGESVLLSLIEPDPVDFRRDHKRDVPQVRAAIRRAQSEAPARLQPPVNRNSFLLGCLDYTELRSEEHLIVGYGFRYGSTTKVETVHHVIGEKGSVSIPIAVGHAMWEYYRQDELNEVILFHNHPTTLLALLLDNLPLASSADRITLEHRALNPQQLLRSVAGTGRVLFYLGENGYVKQFRLPSFASLLERAAVSENALARDRRPR